MAAYVLDWTALLLRWLHFITGVAWIGASFYFVWLDNSLRPPQDPALRDRGVGGELWAIHGGGFYNPQKYTLAPPELPAHLHWFKWEAYTTWLSGFGLLTVLYLMRPEQMLIDPAVAPLLPWQAVVGVLGTMVVAWVVYDLLCRSPLGQREGLLALVVFGLSVALAFGLSRFYAARAAYLLTGATLGTIMVANVFFVIIPGQRALVGAMSRGEAPDPAPGKRAKQRSVHNNYFTLPVLFIMISNHFAFTYGNAWGWLVLAIIMAAGVSIRHFFNLRHRGRVEWRYPALGVALLLGAAVLGAPPVAAGGPDDRVVNVDKMRALTILNTRCLPCHATKPTFTGVVAPPAGVRFDDPGEVVRNGPRALVQVQNRVMPLGNLTQMTEEERLVLLDWLAAGTP
jgi:uncharacterized membrane protein